MQAGMPVKIILRDMIHSVGLTVSRTHVDAAVGKGDPYRPGIPGISAENLQHLRCIIGRQRLIVCMGADRENMHLPGDSGLIIIYRRIRVLLADILDCGIPVSILYPPGGRFSRRSCSNLHRCFRRCRRGLTGGSGHCVLAAQLLLGLCSRHAIRCQLVRLLKSHQGGISFGAEFPIRLACQISELNQLLLHGLDGIPARTFLEVGIIRSGSGCHRLAGFRICGCCGCCRCRCDRIAAVKLRQCRSSRCAVHAQRVHFLERSYGFFRLGAIVPVRLPAQVSQINQNLLHVCHITAVGSLPQRLIGSFCRNPGFFLAGRWGHFGDRSRRRSLLQCLIAEENGISCLSGCAVRFQTVCFLKSLQCRNAVAVKLTIHRSGIVTQLFQPLLNRFRIRTLAVSLHGVFRDRIRGLRGGCRGRLRCRGICLAQGFHVPQLLLCIRPGNAIGCEAVFLLERNNRFLGREIKSARTFPVIIAQRIQPALQFFHFIAGGMLLHRSPGHRADLGYLLFLSSGIFGLS